MPGEATPLSAAIARVSKWTTALERPINHGFFIGDDDSGDDAAFEHEQNQPLARDLRLVLSAARQSSNSRPVTEKKPIRLYTIEEVQTIVLGELLRVNTARNGE